jgi:hypothetical protein
MRQIAPDPEILFSLVDRLSYGSERGWKFTLEDIDRGQGSEGLTLVINITGPDSYHEGKYISVNHYYPVPPAAYNERSWLDWLFEQIGLTEDHERMENFKIDGKPVFPPAHGPGNSPYLRLTYGTDLDRRTSYQGFVNTDPVPAVISAALAEELSVLPGKWVAVIDQRIVAVGENASDVVKAAADPLVFRVSFPPSTS